MYDPLNLIILALRGIYSPSRTWPISTLRNSFDYFSEAFLSRICVLLLTIIDPYLISLLGRYFFVILVELFFSRAKSYKFLELPKSEVVA
jgi:hypothetical protein